MEGFEPPFAVPVTDKGLEVPLDYIWLGRLALICQPLFQMSSIHDVSPGNGSPGSLNPPVARS